MTDPLHNEFEPGSIEARDLAHILHPTTNLADLHEDGPTVHTHAKGVYLWDNHGKQYIEGMAGLWCTALGYGEEELIKAATEQFRKLSYSQLFAGKTHEPSVLLAEKLKEMVPFDAGRVYFGGVRLGCQRHPGQAHVVLPQPDRPAGTQEDHLGDTVPSTASPSPRAVSPGCRRSTGISTCRFRTSCTRTRRSTTARPGRARRRTSSRPAWPTASTT